MKYVSFTLWLLATTLWLALTLAAVRGYQFSQSSVVLMLATLAVTTLGQAISDWRRL